MIVEEIKKSILQSASEGKLTYQKLEENAEKFGNTTIGLRVRDVGVFGFDAFNAESDISNFKGRLKVIQVKQPQVIEPKEIYPQSFGHTAYGVPDIRLKVHYIRPDGNSNQFRKGGSI